MGGPQGPLGWLVRPSVMGIVNVTPDSFSDGGLSLAADAARARIDRLAAEGAAICDLGAESTKPGSERVPPGEQLRRLAPVLEALDGVAPPVPLSVDTTHARVAEAVLDVGGVVINDVSAGREDPEVLSLAAERGAAVVLMHMRGQPRDMQDDPRYDDVVEDVRAFLEERADAALAAGVPREHIVLDPGIGFGKTLRHNVALMGGIPRIRALGFPVLVGVSRKGMIGSITGKPIEGRAAGSVGAAIAAVAHGADVVRVHDVADTVDALAAWTALAPREDP